MDWTEITDWDDAYANHAHIPGADSYPRGWRAAAVEFRARIDAAGRARLDLGYGTGPREQLDLFLPADPAQGLAVFVHGGFWRRFGREDWSHLAAGPLGRGWAVAIPSYTLAPAATVAAITAEVGRAIGCAADLVPGPIRLAGHSAGGHLVSRMVCDGGPLPGSVAERVVHVLSISGLHDLRPLLSTAINADLGLDEAAAAAASPALKRPRAGTRLTVWVGGDERPEFIRQSAVLALLWTGLGAATRSVVEPGRHHFDVIDSLGQPDGALTRALIET